MFKFVASASALAVAITSQAAIAAPFEGPFVGVQVSRDAYEVKAEKLNLGGGLIASADGLSGNGLAGGIYAGYDMPLNDTLFAGVEANFNYSGAKISASGTDGTNSFDASVKARESFGGSARLGAKINGSTGIYARVGYIATKFKTRASLNNTVVLSDKRTEDALLYGAGLETHLNENASLRVEYTREDYRSAGLKKDFGVNGVMAKNDKISLGVSWGF